MANDKDRLDHLEQRLQRIEAALEDELGVSLGECIDEFEAIPDDVSVVDVPGGSTRTGPDSPSSGQSLPPAEAGIERPRRGTSSSARASLSAGPAHDVAERVFSSRDVTATTIMACGAALSFVLAAAYFLRLVYDAGWLTPPVQLGIALLAGCGLILAGLGLADKDRHYASWLPAVGVIILYLVAYAGHLYYELIPHMAAVVVVGAISIGTLVLGRQFENSAYGILAAVGVYLTPALVDSLPEDLVGLLIYFTAWSLLFSFLSLQEGSRVTYLVAMYMAILCFDAAWRGAGQPQWAVAAVYQFLQFAVFAATAAYFSIRFKRPMESEEAVAHGLPLFYFYIVEYFILREHARPLVSVIALTSVAVVVGACILARKRLPNSTGEAAIGLVSAYSAGVTAHIVFFELVPIEFLPWASLVIPIGLSLAYQNVRMPRGALLPIVFASVCVVICGLFLAVTSTAVRVDVPFTVGTLFGYAVVIDIAYVILARDEKHEAFLPALIYAGHLTFMVATVRMLDSGLAISLIWAAFAIAVLVYALKTSDRIAGQSSLLVFSASAVKVLLYDLAGSPSIVRVVTLIVVGASLYVGGWLYQSLTKKERRYHSDPVINRQLKLIHSLVVQGMDDAAIARHLRRSGIACRQRGGWTAGLITHIRSRFELS